MLVTLMLDSHASIESLAVEGDFLSLNLPWPDSEKVELDARSENNCDLALGIPLSFSCGTSGIKSALVFGNLVGEDLHSNPPPPVRETGRNVADDSAGVKT
eukprot:Colp12_sorted_trinity150504_noHs@36436